MAVMIIVCGHVSWVSLPLQFMSKGKAGESFHIYVICVCTCGACKSVLQCCIVFVLQYNLQADMSRRQLEFEGQRLRELLQENLGSSEQIARRHDARLQRIHAIETEMLQAQQRHHQQVSRGEGIHKYLVREAIKTALKD